MKLLKVLAGTHKGAEVMLSPGRYSVGASESMDVSLTDLTLGANDELFLVLNEQGIASLEMVGKPDIQVNGRKLANSLRKLSDFEPVLVGPVAFACGPSDVVWPLFSLDGMKARATNAKKTRWLNSKLVVMLACIASLFGLVGVAAAWQTLDLYGSKAQASELAVIQARVAAAGLSEIVLSDVRRGAAAITGFVGDGAESETLQKALVGSTIDFKQSYKIGTVLAATVKDAIAVEGIQTSYTGKGTVRVEGVVTTIAAKQAIERVRVQLGNQAKIEDHVALMPNVAPPATAKMPELPANLVSVIPPDSESQIPGYLVDKQGAKYFAGSALPNGGLLVEVSEQGVTLRDGSGKLAVLKN